MRIVSFFSLILLSGTVCLGQSADKKSAEVSLSPSLPVIDSKEISLPEISGAVSGDSHDTFHKTGIRAGKILNDPAVKKDEQIVEKDFIIERSSNIRIEYEPEKKKVNHSKERPL